MVAALDPYLAQFVAFQPTCICCGEKLTGSTFEVGMGLTTFRWSLCHGEGECAECRWPSRVYHEAGGLRWEMTLQYHPDQVEQQPRGDE